MRNLLLTLFALLFFTLCNGQTPKTLTYQPVPTYDSLKAVAAYRVTLMADKDRTIAARNTTITTLTGQLATANSAILNKDSIIASQANTITTQANLIVNYRDTIAQLKGQLPCMGLESGDIIDADTFNLQIINTPGNSFEVTKEGNVIKTLTIQGPNRVRTEFVPPYDFDTWVQDSLFTRSSTHLDLR